MVAGRMCVSIGLCRGGPVRVGVYRADYKMEPTSEACSDWIFIYKSRTYSALCYLSWPSWFGFKSRLLEAGEALGSLGVPNPPFVSVFDSRMTHSRTRPWHSAIMPKSCTQTLSKQKTPSGRIPLKELTPSEAVSTSGKSRSNTNGVLLHKLGLVNYLG